MRTYSACVTSILRTYYTWKVVKEPDISYNIIVMGLWTLAEIATGLIISCLPVLPRFLRHAGPKVYRAFSVGSKSSSSSGSASAERKLTSPTFGPRQMASRPKTLNDPRSHQAHVKGDYTELEEYNVVVSKPEAMHQLRPRPTTSNRDVESRGFGFPARDTFYEDTRLDTPFWLLNL